MKNNPTNSDKDKLSKFWFILSNMLPPIGFFLYFKHRKQFPNKAQSAIRSAVIGIPVGLAMGYLMNTFVFN